MRLTAHAVTESRKVLRSMRRREWGLRLAHGLEIQSQDFVAECKLGEGGFASVFRSTFKSQPCAVKRLNFSFPHLDVRCDIFCNVPRAPICNWCGGVVILSLTFRCLSPLLRLSPDLLSLILGG